ncbi:MAG: GDP-mannose 4,6-dehydratase [Actinomycetota bacterium]|jgi:GDP-4-dehydro-6-deoxy-D-mannose reductase|nr:GDP-mannose 4,6-dehydratase [Rubrobacter sp.]MDQ3508022.1 GDP-mannose 4,6-dehydratase [Actinomycetota bacterium]
MTRRALVTGASGFAAPFLIRHLFESGYEITGTTHGGGTSPDARSVPLDITDAEAVRRVVSEFRPDEIYHLAGLTRPASGAVDEFHAVNFGGALNLLEAVKEEIPEASVLLVGSAYAYGRVDRPISEDVPLAPMNHYGVSKAAAEMLGKTYALEGMRVVLARPFNHSGPGQSPDFLLPTLVEQFAEIKKGKRDPVVRLGNLDSARDLSDARDIVRAYRLMLEKGASGEAYNAASGRGTSVEETFEMVRKAAGETEVELEVEASRVRASDIPFLVADIGKAKRELGWEPEISLERTVREMVEDAEARS